MTFLNTARGPSLLLSAALALAGCTTAAPPATSAPGPIALPAPDAHNHDVVLGTFYGSVDETGFHISAGDPNVADGVAGSHASLDLLDPVDAAGFGTSATPSGTTFVALKQTATTQTIPTGPGGAWNVTNCGAVPAGGSCTPILLQNLLPDNELEHSYVEIDIINPATPDGGTAPTITCRSNAADDSGYGVTIAPGCLIRYPDRLARAGVTNGSGTQIDRSSPIFWVFTSDQPSSRFTWKATVKARLPPPVIRQSLADGTTDIPSGGAGYGGGTPGLSSSGNSQRVDVSSDGRYVVFQSTATNLVSGVSGTQIYLRDNSTNSTTVASLSEVTGLPVTTGCANSAPTVSDNGDVAFLSSCQLVAADVDANTDVYVRTGGHTIWASFDSVGNKASGNSLGPAISQNGGQVVFATSATNMTDQFGSTCPGGQRHVWVFDTGFNLSNRVDVAGFGDGTCCPGGSCVSQQGAIDSGGTFAVFSTTSALDPSDSNGLADIYLYDIANDLTTRVSVNESGGQLTGGGSTNPFISSDASTIAFQSLATNILTPITNATSAQIYVRSATSASSVVRVTRTASTNSGNGQSQFPVLSSEGRFVAFVSTATNLDPADSNGAADLFVRDLVTQDTAFQGPFRVSQSERNAGGSSNVDVVTPGLSDNSNYVVFGGAGDIVGNTGTTRQVYRAPTF